MFCKVRKPFFFCGEGESQRNRLVPGRQRCQSRVQNEASEFLNASQKNKIKPFPEASGRLTGAADEQGLAEAQHSGQQEPQATVHGPLWPPAGSRVSPGCVSHALVCSAKPDKDTEGHTVRKRKSKNKKTEKVRFKPEARVVVVVGGTGR